MKITYFKNPEACFLLFDALLVFTDDALLLFEFPFVLCILAPTWKFIKH